MPRQARRAATLVPGASLRGLVFDTCANNCIPNTFGMLQHFGMSHRNRVVVSESPHLNTAALASALRIDEAEVLSRRYPAQGPGHRSFYGVNVLKSRLESRVRRFSPAAIADGILHHPATHELRDLPFSTVGWDLLQDQCPCTEKGVRQGWITVNGAARCDACGGSLGRLEPVMVADNLRGPLELLANLVDPDPEEQKKALTLLPVPVRGASRTLLYDIIMNLAYASPKEIATPDIRASRTAALAWACDALTKWPDGLLNFPKPADCPQHRWEWARKHYAMLDAYANAPSAPSTPLNRGGRGANVGQQPSRTGSLQAKRISTRAAALLGLVDEPAMRNAWDSGRFTQHFWMYNGARVRAFDPAEVLAIAPLLRLARARSHAAFLLGMPLYGVEQLLGCQLLLPDKPSPGVSQRIAHLDAAHALVNQLRAYPQRNLVDPIGFAEAIRHVSGRPKPWGIAIQKMLAGTLGFIVEDETAKSNSSIVKRLVVSKASIPALVAISKTLPAEDDIERADTWSQEDALECLNGNRSMPAPLDQLASIGVTPKRYLVEDILKRAASGVTTSDLARRAGRDPKRTVILLKENSVPQIAPGFWERERAEQAALRSI